MSKVRVLVGTRKGAFVIESDGKRKNWQVQGPHFAGWEIYHMKGSSADPDRIYTSQSSGWFGQIIQRSDDGGRTWHQPGMPAGQPPPAPGTPPEPGSNKFAYDVSAETGKPLTTHQWYDGTQRPWEFKRVWHLEPSLTDPDTVYAGVEDAAIFRSTDGGQNWNELAGLRGHGTGPQWQPGAGGMCLHTIIVDPKNPARIYVAISSAGAFRTDDGGATWKPINRGLHSDYIPDPTAEVGHCVHRIAIHPSRPGVLFMQKHWDVMRSDDSGDSWREVSGNLPTDFGFVIDVHAHEPETIYVVPITSDSERFVHDGKLRVYRSRSGGDQWEALSTGLPQKDCYVNVLRDAMAVDSLDECGIYFGTTGGQVYASADAGETWSAIVRDLPAVLSVEVQTLK
ncbi:MAG: exo-alpha-sialidase [Deltaproteobacteria bacterium]|nr:exo-alpha-sialidase [Deltaproteobacteria bacterium]